MNEREESALLISGGLWALNPAGGHYSISSHDRNADRLLNPPITDHCFTNSPLLSSLLSNVVFLFLGCALTVPSLLSLPRFAAPSLFSSSSSSTPLRPSCPPLIFVYRRSEAPSAGSRLTDWLILSHLSLWMTHYCLRMIYSTHIQRSTVILTSSGVDEKLHEQRERTEELQSHYRITLNLNLFLEV